MIKIWNNIELTKNNGRIRVIADVHKSCIYNRRCITSHDETTHSNQIYGGIQPLKPSKQTTNANIETTHHFGFKMYIWMEIISMRDHANLP